MRTLGTFYSSLPWRTPHGYCSEGTVKAPQYPPCLSCAQPEDIWSHCHRALPPSSWNSSLCNHCETSLTFKSIDRKRSDAELSLSWDMTYSSLQATDTVGFPCSILQDGLSAAHLTTMTFFSTVLARPKWISKAVLKGTGILKWHGEVCMFEPLPRSIWPQQSQGQFSSGVT